MQALSFRKIKCCFSNLNRWKCKIHF